jgi:hypothetical protein
LTVTVSPGVNDESGIQLPPRPSESALNLPSCAPLFEPVTDSEEDVNWPEETPRNEI